MDNNMEAEERALDALLAASFMHPESLTPEEIERLEFQSKRLCEEDESLIRKFDDDYVNSLLAQGRIKDQKADNILNQQPNAFENRFAAVNRNNKSDDMSEATKKKLEEKRQKLLKKELYQHKDKENESKRD